MKYPNLLLLTCFIITTAVSQPVIYFSSPHVINGKGPHTTLFTCDLDMDGDTDIVSSTHDSYSGEWNENNGYGYFTYHHIPTAITDYDCYAGDIDNDGDMDIVYGSEIHYYDQKTSLMWLENTTDSMVFITHNVSGHYDGLFTSLSCSDFDNDSDIDIAGYSTGILYWFENTDGTGNFSSKIIIDSLNPGINKLISGDMNGDNFPDIVSASDTKILLYLNDGNQSFNTPLIIRDNMNVLSGLNLADMDNDGDHDLLVSEKGNNLVYLLVNDGTGDFTWMISVSNILINPVNVIPAFIDNDSIPDIVVSTDSLIVWIRQSGSFSFANPSVIVVAESTAVSYGTFSLLAAADLNGDHKTDIISGDPEYGQFRLSWYLNQGDNSIRENSNTMNSLVYPNPGSGLFNIDAGNIELVEVRNSAGCLVMTTRDHCINLQQFPGGVYIIKVISNNTVTSEKIILTD